MKPYLAALLIWLLAITITASNAYAETDANPDELKMFLVGAGITESIYLFSRGDYKAAAVVGTAAIVYHEISNRRNGQQGIDWQDVGSGMAGVGAVTLINYTWRF